jgi:hypothetical protein
VSRGHLRYTTRVLLRETFPAGPFECNCTVLARVPWM